MVDVTRDCRMTVRCEGKIRWLSVPAIRYIESAGRKVIVHTDNGEITYYDRMGELEETLGERFFRIHRGYLVNLSRVTEIGGGEVTLDSGEHLLLSKYKKAAFLTAYQCHEKNLVR